MKMIKEKLQVFPILITMSCLVSFCVQLVDNIFLASLLFYICILLNLFQFIYLIITKTINVKNIILILLIMLYSFFAVFYKTPKVNLSKDYFNTLIFFVLTVLSLYNGSQITFNDFTKKCIIILTMVVSFIYILYFVFYNNQCYWNNSREYLVFKLSNPNLTGIFLLFLFIFNFFGLFIFEKKLIKFLSIFLNCVLLYFIIETKSRSCLVGLIFFIFSICFFYKFAINKFLLLVGLLIPIIFVIVYMLFINSNIQLGFLNIFVDEGKGLDSRYNIWLTTINSISSNLLLGNYYTISDGTGLFQMHNVWLHVIAGFGSVVWVLLLIYFYSILSKMRVNTLFSKIIVIAFLTVLIEGTFEAAIFTGASGLFCMFSQILSFNDPKNKDVKVINKYENSFLF